MLIYIKSVLVKEFPHDDPAIAVQLAQDDIDNGDLTGWDMTLDTEVLEPNLPKPPERKDDASH